MATGTKKKPQGKAQATTRAQAPKRRRPRKAQAARHDDVEAPERSAPPLAEVDADALEFIEALDRFKKQHGRPFPSWSEVLLVLRQLGYRRA
jgi:hypothetical protein